MKAGITANASCARYVVVTTFTAQLGGTNQTTRGIGVLNHGTSLFSRTSLFAHISVKVLDGQSFAVHKNPFANLGSMLSGTLSHVTLTLKPLTELDNTAFPEPATEAANSAILRNHTRALLTAYFDKTLPEYLKEE